MPSSLLPLKFCWCDLSYRPPLPQSYILASSDLRTYTQEPKKLWTTASRLEAFSARDPQRGTDHGSHAVGRRKRHDGRCQGSPSLGANGIPSSSATFFCTSMMASARANRRVRRAFSR